MVGLDPDVLHALFLLGRLAFLSDLDHSLDRVDEEYGDESGNNSQEVVRGGC
jgi:hypothetical protein